MYLQTPKRPNLPSTPYTQKTTLPPLLLLLQKDFKLPAIDTMVTPSSDYFSKTPLPLPRVASFSQTPSKITLPVNTSMDVSDADISISEMVRPKKRAAPAAAAVAISDSKSFAFISHSPATFPSQEPSIDNAPLARRKRRRTSPNELSILINEFELGSTPNKQRRIDISKKVLMTEKAVQIWFQNRRQSLRKQSATEKEITELPPTPNTATFHSMPPVPLVSSTPTKPPLNKLQSQPHIASPQVVSPLKSRSSSTTGVATMSRPVATPVVSKTAFRPYSASTPTAGHDDSMDSINTSGSGLVLNETNKKQPNFLNSNISSTHTFKLAPAKTGAVAIPATASIFSKFKVEEEENRPPQLQTSHKPATVKTSPTSVSSNIFTKVKLEEEENRPSKIQNLLNSASTSTPRKPLAKIDTNAVPKRVHVSECVENLLSLRAGNWS